MNTETKQQIKEDLNKFVAKVGSQNKASKHLRISGATISHILNNNWESIADTMWHTIQKQINPSANAWVIVETARMRTLTQIYSDAMNYSNVFCVVADEGSGKTEPAKSFVNGENVFLVRCKEHLNRKTFLAELLRSMGKDSGGYTVYEMMDAVIDVLHKVPNPVIILDEADKLSDQVLYFFITIYNETEDKCGIVIQATDHLKKRILKGVAMNKKGYKEIFSRIGRNFISLPKNSQSELKAIAAANGVLDELETTRIANESEGDIRRVKRLVHSYKRIQED